MNTVKCDNTKYRVKWTMITTSTGFVDDGDQDADDWVGTAEEAQKLVERQRRSNRDNLNTKTTFEIVPITESG